VNEIALDRPVVLVIDMHRGSVDAPGTVYVPRAKSIVPTLSSFIDRARALAVPIVYIVHQTHPNGVDAQSPFWFDAANSISHIYPNVGEQVIGSKWTELADGLTVEDGDYLFAKKRYGAFSGNGLDFLLRNLGVKTLLLTGTETEICILATAFHGFNEDYRVVVVSDAVAGLESDCEKAALRIVEREVGHVMTTAEVLRRLDASVETPRS
jgi:nicotinamidase-related amidase